jgi:hypothetical protein
MMRKICLLLLAVCLTTAVFAQKYVPVIKTGTVLGYSVLSKALGQAVPLTLTMTSVTAPVTMKWRIDGYGTGSFEVSAKAVEAATKMAIRQPEPDGTTKLKDDETLLLMSKTMFAGLVQNKTFVLNGKTFNVVADTSAFKINDKEADVFYAQTENGKVKIWVLNNPAFPIICKSVGSLPGIDITLTSVTE